MKHCQHCGEKVHESAKFCNHCGKNLVDDVQSVNEQTADADKIATVDQANTTGQEDKPKEEFVSPNPEHEVTPTKKSSKGLIFGLIAVAVMFVLLIGTYFVGQS